MTYYYRFYPIVFHSFSDAVIGVGEIKKKLWEMRVNYTE